MVFVSGRVWMGVCLRACSSSVYVWMGVYLWMCSDGSLSLDSLSPNVSGQYLFLDGRLDTS